MTSMQLYTFQTECVDKLGKPEILSRLIGDDMGLGKTVEAIVIDRRLREKSNKKFGSGQTTLIVAPLSVHTAWHRHLKKICPESGIYVIDKKDRTPFVQIAKRHKADYVICHYEALRLMPELRETTFFHIVADEVHSIKSRKSQQTRAVKALDTHFKTGLSGTPADNKPQDLWSILNWLYPRQFSSYWRFIKEYCIQDMDRSRGGTTFRRVVDVNRTTIGNLLTQMEPWYVRRLKENVLPDLPSKYYSTREVELLPSQRKAYNQMRKDMIAWVGEHEDEPLVAPVVIAQLVRLQQFALASPALIDSYRTTDVHALRGGNRPAGGQRVVLQEPSSKLDELCNIAEENPQEPLIVFTQSRGMVDLVQARLAKKFGIRVGKYKGAMPQADRDWVVDAFQGGDLDVFAGTIAAGGQSITLTRSSTVIFLDRHWNPSKNKQAEDRAHRIGQENAVQVIDIVAKNTVDLGRLQQIATKWSTLKVILGDTVDPQRYVNLVEGDPPTREAIHDVLSIV